MEWISVKDRLPENHDAWRLVRYLIYSEKDGIALGNYKTNDGWYAESCSDWHRYQILNVTHWMPLPEPPQAKSWAACIGDARDGTTISITIDVSDSNLPLSEFENRVYKIFERAMTGIKREWGDDG